MTTAPDCHACLVGHLARGLQPTGAVRPGLRPGLGAGGGQRTVDFGMRWLFARS